MWQSWNKELEREKTWKKLEFVKQAELLPTPIVKSEFPVNNDQGAATN